MTGKRDNSKAFAFIRLHLRQNSPEIRQADSTSAIRARRFQALLEIIFATDLLATLVFQGIFYFLGFKTSLILRSSRLLAAFVICDSLFVLATIALILRARNESWQTVSGTCSRYLREALIGLALVPALFLATSLVGVFFRKYFPHLVTEQNPLLSMIKTPRDVIWFLVMVSFSGGIKEEVQRAFVLRRFEKYLGGIYAGLAVFTLYFGSAHYLQGWDNAASATVLGLLFGLAYIWRQNLLVPLVAHAAYDWIVVIGYWFIGIK
ncbi:MAG TPA: CPBP family intramembrane glutamic endopeptidase [Acidobacteriota bacterium]|jgi:hypothetical protein|nr:CPBP family intramembrane glutamic endopeptidase [Acidobacteriota bacterium]